MEQPVLEQIVNTAQDGLLVVAADKCIVFANPAAADFLEEPIESLVGSKCSLPFSLSQTLEHEWVGGAGQTAVLEIKTALLIWQGQPAHLLTLRDITKYRRLAEHMRYVALLGDITRAALGDLSRQEMFQMLADRLGELHQADGCFLTLWDEEKQTAVLKATFGPLKDLYPQLFANNALMRLLGDEQKITAISDIRDSRYFTKKRIQTLPIHSLLLLPLTLNDQYLGAVVLLFVRAAVFDEEALAQAQQAAEQTTLVLAKERLLTETQRRSRDLETLKKVSAELRNRRRVDEMLPLILQTADLTDHTISALFLQDPAHDQLVAAGYYAVDVQSLPAQLPNRGILHHVLLTKRPYVTQRLLDDPVANEFAAHFRQAATTQGNIFLPLQSQDGDVAGVLYVGLCQRREFSGREIELLTAVTEIAVSSLQRTLLLQTLEKRVQQRTQELADANDKLRQLDRLRAKFVTDMSHELRTPVTTFQLYLDLIDRAPVNKRERYFAILRNQTERLTQLIDKALTLSRVDIAPEEVVFGEVNFNGVVETAVSTYQSSATGKEQTIHFTPKPSLPYLSGSQTHLQTMVSELLDNAIGYTPDGGSIWVELCLDTNGQQINLKIADNGVGVAAADIPHLFERFYRGTNVSQLQVPGTGLGLAIVQEVVSLHGGQAKIESWEEGGTAVFISLPLPASTK